MRRIALSLFLLAGCGASAPHAGTPSAEPRIRGAIELPAGASGTLIVSWLTPEEMGDRERPLGTLFAAVERAVLLPASAGSVPFELRPVGAPRAHVVAWLDSDRRGLEVLLSAPAHSEPVDPRAGELVRVTMAPPSDAPPIERCVGERRELIVLDAPRGTAEGPAHARLCVMLPREQTGPLPVIYALPGLGGTHTNGSANNARAILDAMGERDAIVVGVENVTAFGSSYLIDSPLTGAWGGFLPERVVGEIDRRYRTIATREGRAVIGHSTGGINAVSIGIAHPEVFGVIGASSPDALDFESWMLEEGRVRPLWLTWLRFEAALGGMGQFASYASAWSPDPSAPRGFAWPIDLESGALIEDVWSRWLAHSPVTWLDDPEALERARRFSDRIFLTCGSEDEARLFEPTRRFSEALDRAGITHAWVPTSFPHVGHDERFEPMIRYLLDRLATE